MFKSCSILSTSYVSAVILVFWYSSDTAHLLALRVCIPPGAWVSISCEWCVLLGRGLCDGQISPPEESYLQWCVRLCVILKPQQWNDVCSSGAVAPQEKNPSVYSAVALGPQSFLLCLYCRLVLLCNLKEAHE